MLLLLLSLNFSSLGGTKRHSLYSLSLTKNLPQGQMQGPLQQKVLESLDSGQTVFLTTFEGRAVAPNVSN